MQATPIQLPPGTPPVHRITQLFKPPFGPGEFGGEQQHAQRNEHHGRAGSEQHDHAGHAAETADEANDDLAWERVNTLQPELPPD